MSNLDRAARREIPKVRRDAEHLGDATRPRALGRAVAEEPAGHVAGGATLLFGGERTSDGVQRKLTPDLDDAELSSPLGGSLPEIPTSRFERHVPVLLRTETSCKTDYDGAPESLVLSRTMAKRREFTDADLTPFGRRLKEAIEEAGYTQTSFGRAAGFSSSALSRMMYDQKLSGLSFDSMERIEFLTGYRIQYLARGELPRREKEPSTPMKKAASLARADGVPEDIIAHVCRHYELAPWDTQGWFQVIRNAQRRAADDEKWREAFRRVRLEKRERDEESLRAATMTLEAARREIAG